MIFYEEGTFRANANIEGLAGNVTPYWSSPHICLIMLLFRKRYFSRRKYLTPLVCESKANFFRIHVRILRSFRRAWFCFNSKKTWNPLLTLVLTFFALFFKGPVIFLGNLNVFMERSILFFTVPLFVILLIPRQGSDIVNLVSRISHRSKRGIERETLVTR